MAALQVPQRPVPSGTMMDFTIIDSGCSVLDIQQPVNRHGSVNRHTNDPGGASPDGTVSPR